MRTRIAPTPSGYVHLGNVVNFMITAHLATELNADVMLRIDDLDSDRVRSAYVEDVFRVLNWLDVSWQEGPRSASDMASWSQETRMDSYRRARDVLVDQSDSFFACMCSRAFYSPLTCTCMQGSVALETGISALRMQTEGYGAPIVWRRDGLPAYHLASVIDDSVFGVDLIVRGDDLRESTEIQRILALHLTGTTFADATVLHHPLVTDAQGEKLSKSAGARPSPLDLTEELRDVARGHIAAALPLIR